MQSLRWRYIWKKWGEYLVENFSSLFINDFWSAAMESIHFYLFLSQDLLDLSKDNLQINESKTQGIYISGATEVRMKNATPSFHSSFLWYSEGNTCHQDLHAFTSIFGICSITPADIYTELLRCIRKPFCKSSWAYLDYLSIRKC